MKQDINGLLLLNKPLRESSNGVLQRIRWLFKAKKAGHTGTLDPLATGMLPICFGEATKIGTLLLDGVKGYSVTAHLGLRTSTSDLEGEFIDERPVPDFSQEELEQVIKENFFGVIEQTPSIWSALKYNGKPLYEYARAGKTVPIPSRQIEILKIDIVEWNKPYLTLQIECSKGTYIRTLVDNLGEKLGCGAHVSKLHRDFVAPFKDHQMVTMEQIEELAANNPEGLSGLLLGEDYPAIGLPRVDLTDEQCFKICQGMATTYPGIVEGEYVRLYHHEFNFIGLGIGEKKDRVKGFRLTSKTPVISEALRHTWQPNEKPKQRKPVAKNFSRKQGSEK